MHYSFIDGFLLGIETLIQSIGVLFETAIVNFDKGGWVLLILLIFAFLPIKKKKMWLT